MHQMGLSYTKPTYTLAAADEEMQRQFVETDVALAIGRKESTVASYLRKYRKKGHDGLQMKFSPDPLVHISWHREFPHQSRFPVQ